MKKYCICLICNIPNVIYLDFLKKMNNYDIVIIIDDVSKNYKDIYFEKYPTFTFVQLNNVECMEMGFQLSNLALNKIVSGWDKAICFFSVYEKNYYYVWYIEDDIFFYSEQILLKIDSEYPDSDLLVKQIDDRNGEKWLWDAVNINLQKPHYNGLVCACRVSRSLHWHIYNYVAQNKQLFFIEMLFMTIAKYHNLKCDSPIEMVPIVYRHDWNINNVNKVQFFHPIKDLEVQKVLRDSL